MDIPWITFILIEIILLTHPTSGQSEFEVQLVVRKYVEKGSSVTMHCEHNVKPQILYKVTWLKNGVGKFFEYITGRNPPFRNFSIPGGEIDWSNSNEGQVTLKNLDFDATGLYYCEVSTDTPIFTKPSQDDQLHVILPQNGPPRISFNKRHFSVGEKLIANCTTTKARPAPHITWLINGKKVDEKHVRALHPYAASGKNSHRSKSHQPQPQPQNSQSVDKYDSSKGLRPANRKDDSPYGYGSQYEIRHHDNANNHNTFSQTSNSHEINHKTFDNKFFETVKHRNSFKRQYRRYVSETVGNIGSSGSMNSGSISSGGTGLSTNSGNRQHRSLLSSSQLNIEVSESHVGINGRVEITCLATIPAHVGIGEQFADYKTMSIKIDIDKPELSSMMPPMSGMAALGNASSGCHNKLLSYKYLTFLLIILIF